MDVRVGVWWGVWWGVPQTPTPPDCPSVKGLWGIWVGVEVFFHKTSKNQQNRKTPASLKQAAFYPEAGIIA